MWVCRPGNSKYYVLCVGKKVEIYCKNIAKLTNWLAVTYGTEEQCNGSCTGELNRKWSLSAFSTKTDKTSTSTCGFSGLIACGWFVSATFNIGVFKSEDSGDGDHFALFLAFTCITQSVIFDKKKNPSCVVEPHLKLSTLLEQSFTLSKANIFWSQGGVIWLIWF